MTGRLKKLLPWNRRSLSDLPRDQFIRVRSLMLGAGARMRADEDGMVRFSVQDMERGA